MVERHSWASQQVAGVGVQTVEDARHSMGSLWIPASAITNRSGLVPSGTAAVPGSVLATGTPNGFVHVQPFRFVLQSVRGGGVYIMCLDAIKDIDILGAGGQSADPSNARIDLIIAQQNDTYFSDANSDMTVKRIGGTPSGSPAVPTVPGSQDYVVLAQITVPALATTITTGNIAVTAQATAVTVGGILPVGSNTVRDALANPYDGMPVYRKDTDWIEVYDGTAWRTPALVKTSALANITAPFTGQLALLTSDNKIYRWNGSAWTFVIPADGGIGWGRIASGARSGASATPGTTETVIDTLTATLVSGRRYRFIWDGGVVGVTGGNVNYGIQFRYATGGTLTTAGTSFRTTTTQIVATGSFEPRYCGISEFVAPSSGTFTVGMTLKMATTGTVRSDGGVYFHLDDIGL